MASRPCNYYIMRTEISEFGNDHQDEGEKRGKSNEKKNFWKRRRPLQSNAIKRRAMRVLKKK